MSNYNSLETIRDFLRIAISQFNHAELYYGHGTNNAWDEALRLILHTLHLPPEINPHLLDAKLTPTEREQLSNLIERRIQERIPVAYLIHEAWFAGLPFYIDERVLIPRSSFGELITQQFEPWIELNNVHHVLDLCTGSGCIAIACAKLLPNAKITASDISTDALKVAKINVLRHNVADQITLVESDVFSNLSHSNLKYDLIISNPPYVSTAEMFTLPHEYRHEPELGLAAGQSGLDIINQILHSARQYLQPGGHLIVEVGNSETDLIAAYPTLPFTWLDFEYSEGGVFMLTYDQLNY